MDKIYHVFVSSTYSDLKDERKKVSEAIAKSGYVPEGMELFPASSQKQFQFIKRIIDRCDYYVVIVGGRYGTLADDNVSYTELEYEYAIEKSVPRLAFLHRDPDKIESGKSEKRAENIERLQRFRDRLSDSGLVDFWDGPDDLAAKVVIALGQESTLNPGTGWVRGNMAADPNVYQELEAIRKERDDLKNQIVEENFSFPGWLPPLAENFNVEFRLEIVKSSLRGTDRKNNIEFSKDYTVQLNWNLIFSTCANYLYKPIKETRFYDTCLVSISNSFIKDKDIPDVDNRGSYAEMLRKKVGSSLNYEDIRDAFVGYGLMTHTTIQVEGKSSSFFELTDKGKRYLAYLNVQGK